MVNWINSWAKGIIVAVIISTIIEMIIPNGNIKKYIKTVIGVYIVFTIIAPVITKITGQEIDIDKYINLDIEKYKVQQTSVIDTDKYIEQTYLENIKNDIIENIKTKGYEVKQIELEIEDNEVEYGKLKSVNLTISKSTNNSIKPIEINVNVQNNVQENHIDENEIVELKEFLRTTYGIEYKNIIIN